MYFMKQCEGFGYVTNIVFYSVKNTFGVKQLQFVLIDWYVNVNSFYAISSIFFLNFFWCM